MFLDQIGYPLAPTDCFEPQSTQVYTRRLTGTPQKFLTGKQETAISLPEDKGLNYYKTYSDAIQFNPRDDLVKLKSLDLTRGCKISKESLVVKFATVDMYYRQKFYPLHGGVQD